MNATPETTPPERGEVDTQRVVAPLIATLCFAALLALVHLGVGAAADQVVPRHSTQVRDLLGILLVVLALGVVVGWCVRRWVPRLDGGESGRGFGAWLLAVRWIALWSVVAVSFVATVLDARLGPGAVALLWSGVGLLFFFDLFVTRLGPSLAQSPRWVYAQVLVDAGLLALCLHASGGITNPFAALFVFHAVIAGLLLPRSLAPRAVVLVAAIAALLAALESSGLVPALPLSGAATTTQAEDRLLIAASGVAVLTLTLGCGLLVAALMKAVRQERDTLARSSLERGKEARELASAQSSLAAEQRKLNAVIECIADAVLFAGPDGRIILRNRAANSLWPGRPEGPANDLRVCHSESRWAQMLDRLVHAGDLEHHPLLPIGGRMYEATYGRVTGSDGVSLGAVMVARDVTERLREEGLRAERERMATIGKLAAGLAHEINNPLGSIQLYTQHALKRVDGQDPLADHLATVLRNANVCKKIVRDLLEYARQRPPETRRITADELVALTRKTVEPRASSLGVQLVVNVVNGSNSSNGATLDVDPDQIVQVLVNLALNGIDAMAELPPERPRVLTLTVAATKSEVSLSVEDSGDGVSEEHRATIFSPFFTTKSEGTGLGLAVAKDIVRAHGGRIELAHAVGGARFVVTLPRSVKSEVNP